MVNVHNLMQIMSTLLLYVMKQLLNSVFHDIQNNQSLGISLDQPVTNLSLCPRLNTLISH